MKVTRPLEPEPRFRAPCGVFCPTCFLYMGNHDDPARLPHASVVLGVPEEDLRYEGCGSPRTAVGSGSAVGMASAGRKTRTRVQRPGSLSTRM